MNQELSVYKNIIDGFLELKLAGFVTAANAGKILEAANGEASPFQNVTIDAGELAYISSAGLRQLVQLITIAESRNGQVVMRNVREDIREILDMTGLSGDMVIEP